MQTRTSEKSKRSPRRAAISHLVVVAGVSSSGKSTFLRDLAKDELWPEARNTLPSNAANWRQVNASQHPKWLPSLAEGADREVGLVLHYDLNRLSAWGEYHRDPALQVVGLAQGMTVINLRPSLERLNAHLQSTKKRRRHKAPPRVLWDAARLINAALLALKTAVPRWLTARAKRIPMVSASLKDIGRQAADKYWNRAAQYRDEGAVNDIYSKWDAYLCSVAERGTKTEKITLHCEVDNNDRTLTRWQVGPQRPEGKSL